MKTRTLLLISLLLTLALTACGGGDKDSGDPVGVVKDVVKAMETLDVEEASKYFCADKRDELEGSMQEGFEDLEEMGLDPDDLLEAFKINMKDMKYEEKSKGDDKAVVHVEGNISLDFDTDKLKEFFKKAAEASGQEVSDDELDMVIGLFTAMGGQEAPFEDDVEVVKEDGKWMVCDELNFLDEIDLGF